MVSYMIEDRRGRRKALLSDIKGEGCQAAACTPGPTAPNPPQTPYTSASLMGDAARMLPQGAPSTLTAIKSTPTKLTQWRLSDPRVAWGSNKVRCRLCYDQHHVWRVTVFVTLPETLPYVLRGELDR